MLRTQVFEQRALDGARTNRKAVAMEGPKQGYREYIAEQINALVGADDGEDELDRILGDIQDKPASYELAPFQSEDDAYRELAAIEAWASLASNAVHALTSHTARTGLSEPS